MCGGGEHFSVYVNNKKDRLRYDANHTDAVVSEKSNGEIYDDDLRIISTFLHQWYLNKSKKTKTKKHIFVSCSHSSIHTSLV